MDTSQVGVQDAGRIGTADLTVINGKLFVPRFTPSHSVSFHETEFPDNPEYPGIALGL
jgi:hypothetical protein